MIESLQRHKNTHKYSNARKGGDIMEREDFDKVRESVRSQCGSRVVIQLDRGRNKVDIQQGVIQEAYPSVFTILMDDTETSPSQLLSFSYTDIITKEIRMKLC
nr:Veg family protein [Pseudobutyrivibrio sp.]